MSLLLLVVALAAAAPSAPQSWTYQGTLGPKLSVRLYLEQTPAGLRGLYFYDRRRGELASDLTLEGHAADGRVSLTERDGKGTETGRFALQGALGAPLAGTWSAGRRSLAVSLQPGRPFAEAGPSTSFRGFIDARHQVWVNLRLAGKDLNGDYRYARSQASLKLTGRLTDDQGGFALDETDERGRVTGRIVGRFLERREIAGNWLNPDGTKRLPLRLSEADALGEAETLAGGLRVIPRQEVRQHRACISEITWPELAGGTGDVSALNALLQRAWREADLLTDEDCEAVDGLARASGVVGFEVESLRRGHLTLAQTAWAYTGGTHGNGASECRVFDLAGAREVSLKSALSEDSRQELSRLVSQQLRADLETQSLSGEGFSADEVELSPEVDLCPLDDGLMLQFDPYEIGPYALGPIVVTLPYEKVRGLFAKNAVTEALLGR